MPARYVLETYLKRKLNPRKLLWNLVGVNPDTPQLWPLSKLAIQDPFHLGRDREGLFPYEIPNSFRKTHTYIIGKSGKGKSKLLEHMLVTDIMAGRGCCVIDPHGDLAEDVLSNLHSRGYFNNSESHKRVIYFEPSRSDYTLPFNILNLPYVASDKLAEQTITAFKRAWPTLKDGAPRFQDIALPALRVLIEAGQTLVDLRRFLVDQGHRQYCISRVADQHLAINWTRDFESPDVDQLKNIESVRNKLTPFVYNTALNRSMRQPTNIFNFKEIMDKQKVLIVNLRGFSDEVKPIWGSMLVMGFEQSAIMRGENRTPYYLYLDEFQSYLNGQGSSETLSNILSQCRKFGLRLILAHQQVSQLSTELDGALGNVNVKIVFCSEYPDAKALIHRFWIAEDEALKVDPLAGVIQKLFDRTALVKMDGFKVAQFVTEPIPPYSTNPDDLEKLKVLLMATAGGIPADKLKPAFDAVENIQFMG